MPRALRFSPGPLHDPCPGTKYLWRQGRTWVANEHAEWGGVGPGLPGWEGRGTQGGAGARGWK